MNWQSKKKKKISSISLAFCFFLCRVRLRNDELQKINVYLKAENESLRNGESPRSNSSGNIRRVKFENEKFEFENNFLFVDSDRWIGKINGRTWENHRSNEKTKRSITGWKSKSSFRSRTTPNQRKSSETHRTTSHRIHFQLSLDWFESSIFYSSNGINSRYWTVRTT